MLTKKMMYSITSIFMAVLLIVLSVSAPVGALTEVSATKVSKIDSALKEKMETASPDEKIPVAIWYSDVDQDNIDRLTAQKVGFTQDDIAVAYEMPSNELLSSLEKEELGAKDEMQSYLTRTERFRELERKRTDEYIMTRREYSRSKYNEKSAKVIKDIEIEDNDIVFKSQYAPMIIAEMTTVQINNISNNLDVLGISYYEEVEMYVEDHSTALEITNVNKATSNTGLNLSGDNVKVGIIENYSVWISSENHDKYYISPDIEPPTTYSLSDGTTMTNYGNVIVVGDTAFDPDESHPSAVANTLLAVSPNVTLYSSKYSFSYIESMITDGVQILSCSLGIGVLETSSEYGYNVTEKWFDHIIAEHNVIFIKSAGNNGEHTGDYTYQKIDKNGVLKTYQAYGPRVTSPGMAYNALTIGAYNEMTNPPSLYSYSSYKNSITREDGTTISGCAKPDVVAPANFNGGGTSNAAPFVAGIIALMYQLKPSLATYPQVIKAIVLASCHGKVVQNNGVQETMFEGITERQGAGAPDAFAMASIICNGTYGIGKISAARNQSIRRFVMPSYGATSMNVSISWIRENTIKTNLSHNSDENITPGDVVNLDLSVYRNDGQSWTSSLTNSSTEMVYFDLNNSYNSYEIRINDVDNYDDVVRYGYAYSTNNPYLPPVTEELEPQNFVTDEGIYYIRNYYNDKYLTLDTTTGETTLQNLATTAAGRQNQMWVLKGSQSDYELLPAYGSVGQKLNIGSQIGTNPYYKAIIGTSDLNLTLKSWETDSSLEVDSYAFTSTNGSYHHIMSYTSSYGIFSRSSTEPVMNVYRMWMLEDVNYLLGDVDMDGNISSGDCEYIQRYTVGQETLNNTKFYLGDFNKDGVVNIRDSTELQRYIADI